MKLIIVDPQNDPKLIDHIYTKILTSQKLPYNFFSLLQVGISLSNLFPKDRKLVTNLNRLDLTDEEIYNDIDMKYVNLLYNDDEIFNDLMKLVSAVYDNEEDTILLTDMNSRIISILLEIILKSIKERYGINPIIIRDVDDIDSFQSPEIGNIYQQQNYYNDLQRWIQLGGEIDIKKLYQDQQEDINIMRGLL